MYDEERKYAVIEENKDPQYRQNIWDMASGLQKVDGLSLSKYAQKVGNEYISGKYDASETSHLIASYYGGQKVVNLEEREADIVTARIIQLLATQGRNQFELSPKTLLIIHGTLFAGVLEDPNWVGVWRWTNIAKREPVLGGRSVAYAPAVEIVARLNYDIQQEQLYRYSPILTLNDCHHFADFISKIWQIHPFREGNTRSTAVFAQCYLKYLGIEQNNQYYKDHSQMYRDALVRANFADRNAGISPEPIFLYKFFENTILGAEHDLASLDLNLHGIRVVPVEKMPYREIKSSAEFQAANRKVESVLGYSLDPALENKYPPKPTIPNRKKKHTKKYSD